MKMVPLKPKKQQPFEGAVIAVLHNAIEYITLELLPFNSARISREAIKSRGKP